MAEPRRAADRLDELLVARATEGLAPAEQRELERLLAERPEADAEGYERAAAAIALAALGAPGALPAAVRERLARSAESFMGRRR